VWLFISQYFAVFALFFIFQCLIAVKFKWSRFQLGSNKACNLCPHACLYSVTKFSTWILSHYFRLYNRQHTIFIVSFLKLFWNQLVYFVTNVKSRRGRSVHIGKIASCLGPQVKCWGVKFKGKDSIENLKSFYVHSAGTGTCVPLDKSVVLAYWLQKEAEPIQWSAFGGMGLLGDCRVHLWCQLLAASVWMPPK
jgi:hypothetical protein